MNTKSSAQLKTGDNSKEVNFEAKADYLKNARRYHLKDLEVDDNFYVDTVIPYERAKECFVKVNRDYSIQNLKLNRLDINLILSQEFAALAGACESRELVELCYNMLLYDLVDEEGTFYNTIALMLQGIQQLLIPPKTIM